ncbi:MAG: hypothetical protein AB7J28_08065 [Hyphomonadaceae bacterium]
MRPLLPLIASAAALVACAGESPPRELQGLWGQGPAACDAGIGVTFAAGAVQAHYADDTQTLLDQPRYALERRGERVRVEISYRLPRPPGAGHVSARGELLLERGADGWLHTVSHRITDARTGAARVSLGADPVSATFRLRRCGPDAWIAGLRGRDA